MKNFVVRLPAADRELLDVLTSASGEQQATVARNALLVGLLVQARELGLDTATLPVRAQEADTDAEIEAEPEP